jgi:hypothetical protein
VGLHPEGQQNQRQLAGQRGDGGANFSRTVPFDKLAGVMTAAQVEQQRAAGLLVELAGGP